VQDSRQPTTQALLRRRTPEDIAETLDTPHEYLWAVQRKFAWGSGVVLLALALVIALAAVGYIGGRQFYVFSGLGAPFTESRRAYFDAHKITGMTLAQTAPAVPQDWPVQLAQGVWKCWEATPCRANLTGPQWAAWQDYGGKWFPQLGWAVLALQMSAGAFLLALVTYLFAWADVSGWSRWEQRQRLALRKAQSDRQRRGG
jgi:hypothetical protein